MFRHVVLFRWVAETTEDQKRAIRAALGRLPSVIPELRDYRFGDDAGLAEGNWDFAVVADFDDQAGWRVYTDHPEHQQVIADYIRPVLAQRAAIQYET